MYTKSTISIIVLVLLMQQPSFSKTKITLQKSFEQKLIKAKAICTGGLELNYIITNLLKDSLVLVLPPGWRFNSNDPKNDYQDILVTKQHILVLKAKETKTFHIKGFCCEYTKSGPVNGIAYTNGKLADSTLVNLARYLAAQKIDENAQQHSVWAISDKQETANITSQQDSLAQALRNYVATLKGEPLPWYTLFKKSGVSRNGTIVNQPICFKTDITYNVTKDCYSYCFIVDEKGNVVSEIFGKWLYANSNDYKASFDTRNLKPGSYKLVLKNSLEPLFEREFKI